MAILAMWSVGAHARDFQAELYLGPAFTSINGTVYAGVGIGGGGSYDLVPTSLGPLQIRLAAMPVFGRDLDAVFTITQVHVPLTAVVSFLELPRDRRGLGLGGAVGLGITATLSQLHDHLVAQPSAMVELTLGVFQRGALTVRYQTTIADVVTASSGAVGYNSLVFIASTVW